MAKFRYKRGDRPLDGYTVEHGLGVGGFGEVYFAVSDSGREVALKAVQNYQEIELRGIRNCMNLKSPYLVSIFDVRHDSDGEPFVIMEFVDGPSLRTLLDAHPEGLGVTKAAFFLREMAKGLTYLHDAGVVHRDLKPHNVFYEEGYVKIGDYSLCKLISSTQHSGHTMTVGSVHYMAPEISHGQYNSSVDIYALGAMLYEMLTGKPPFQGQSIGEILMKHLNEEPDLSLVEEPFRSVVRRAMAKDPADRYVSPAEMVSAVYGSQDIENSVGAFDPTELTLVAARVAAPARHAAQVAGGGGGDSAGSDLPYAERHAFESGDPSAWKHGSSPAQSPPPIPTASQETLVKSNTIASAMDQQLSGVCELDDGPTLAEDRMPTTLRYFLGFLVTLLPAYVAGFHYTGTAQIQSVVISRITLLLILSVVVLFSILRETVLRKISIDSHTAPRFLIGFTLLVLVPLSAKLMLSNYAGPPYSLMVAALLPMVLLTNLHRLTHARRSHRIHLLSVLAVGFASAVLTICFGDSVSTWPMVLAVGSMMSIQIVSPLQRVAR